MANGVSGLGRLRNLYLTGLKMLIMEKCYILKNIFLQQENIKLTKTYYNLSW